MLQRIKDLLSGLNVDLVPHQDTDDSDSAETGELGLAVAALMIEAAGMDESFEAAERAQIRALLMKRFDLAEPRADHLMENAQGLVDESNQLYGFTRIIKDRFSYEERVELMEMLWQVSYADGELHDYEANLMRRIAGLLYVEDRDSGEARKRAIRQLAGAE